MSEKELGGLFEFGTNENGEYVNLVEEEKIKNDIDEKSFHEWLDHHENPLIRLAADFLVSYYELETKTYNELKEKLERIVEQKTYHYGNMAKDFYIYTLNAGGNCYCFVFDTPNYIMANLNYCYGQKEVDKVLFGEELIQMNALSVRCYTKNGNRIDEYSDNDPKDDIRYKVVMDEWQMHKFGENRIRKGKKIKDFYEVAIALPKLIEYWGESE